MTRLLLILVMLVHLSGCAVVLETAAGSFVGGLAVEVVKGKMDEAKDEAKEDEVPQP